MWGTNRMKKMVCGLCLMAVAHVAVAQTGKAVPQADSTDRWSLHTAVQTGVVADGRCGVGYLGVAPSQTYRASDKLHISAEASMFSTSTAAPIANNPTGDRPLVPRRNSGMLVGAQVAADYLAADNLLIGASVYFVGGQMSPLLQPTPWTRGANLSACGVEASLSYKTKHDNILSLDLRFHHEGAADHLYPWWGTGEPVGLFGQPTTGHSIHNDR